MPHRATGLRSPGLGSAGEPVLPEVSGPEHQPHQRRRSRPALQEVRPVKAAQAGVSVELLGSVSRDDDDDDDQLTGVSCLVRQDEPLRTHPAELRRHRRSSGLGVQRSVGAQPEQQPSERQGIPAPLRGHPQMGHADSAQVRDAFICLRPAGEIPDASAVCCDFRVSRCWINAKGCSQLTKVLCSVMQFPQGAMHHLEWSRLQLIELDLSMNCLEDKGGKAIAAGLTKSLIYLRTLK